MIRFRKYNIRNRRNEGLESALRGITQDILDQEVFQNTKVAHKVHISDLVGYCVLAPNTPSRYPGGIAALYIDVPHYQVKAYQPHVKNMAIFQSASGRR